MDRFSILLKPIILVHYQVFKKEYYIHVNFCGSCCFVFFLTSLFTDKSLFGIVVCLLFTHVEFHVEMLMFCFVK